MKSVLSLLIDNSNNKHIPKQDENKMQLPFGAIFASSFEGFVNVCVYVCVYNKYKIIITFKIGTSVGR